MQCVTTTSLSILINGSPYSFFKPKRGLRQGDPLSSFLFILTAEILARLIKREEANNKIIGYKQALDLTPITHLQFTDDLFIFAQAMRRIPKNKRKIYINKTFSKIQNILHHRLNTPMRC